MAHVKKHPKLIILWLSLCALLVVGMVAVGGYTRLSGSGLSITEWKPIHGVIPPRGEDEWQEEFEKYKQIPQYAEINKGMSLDAFKTIFWPEYWHRVLGRVIGIVFFFPLVGFFATGAIGGRFALKLAAIFALGGLQGFMGWYMVSSGLIQNVYVNHLRLAAHFSLALLLLGLILWQICSLSRPKWGDPVPGDTDPSTRIDSLRISYIFWFTLLCLQLLYGAFMAGLHAGLLYNTYPDMNGKMLPDGLWEPAMGITNLFENRTTVQFIHRTLAACVVAGFGFWWFVNRPRVTSRKLVKTAAFLAMVIAAQFALGVLTLVNAVPLELGLMHQLTAVLLFGLSVIMLHQLGTRRDN